MSWDLSSEEVITNKLESQQKTIFVFTKKIKQLEEQIIELKKKVQMNIHNSAFNGLMSENKELKEALDWSTTIAMEALLKQGHRGSNQEDRMADDNFFKAWEVRVKFKLEETK